MEHDTGVLLAVILVVALLVTTNLWLVGLWRQKDDPRQSEWVKKVGQSLPEAWTKDARQLQELSERVDQLRRSPTRPEDGGCHEAGPGKQPGEKNGGA